MTDDVLMDDGQSVQLTLSPGRRDGRRLLVWARSIRGKVRAENQDAWCIAAPDGVWCGPPGPKRPEAGIGQGRLAFGVFDGLGGHENGREAAQAAARALPKVVDSGRMLAQVVPSLERAVEPTGGMTTALVVVVEEGVDQVRVFSKGDSAAFALGADGGLRRVNELDRSGRHELSDCLGRRAQRAVPEGHEVRLPLGRGLVLTTDGVADEVPFEREWGGLLSDPVHRAQECFNRLFQAVWEKGARDNATTILVRPSGPL